MAPQAAPCAKGQPRLPGVGRRRPRAGTHQQVLQGDSHGAGLAARAAQRRHEGKIARRRRRGALQQRGDDGPDRAGVRRPVGLPAHRLPHGARVQAGPAADARQCLLELRAAKRAAPAVDDDQMELLRPVCLALTARAGDEVHVVGGVLAYRGHGQHLQDVRGLVPVGHHALHAHHRHVNAWLRRDQPCVALVLDDAHGAGGRHAQVHARHAHPGLRELLAKAHARVSHQPFAVIRHVIGAGLFPEQLCHLRPVQVHGRRDDVRGVLARQLQDPLAQVGLDHLEARALERLVQLDLLGGHRLALGHHLHAPRLGKTGDVPAGLGTICRAHHGAAGLAHLGLHLAEQGRQVADVLPADVPRALAHVVEPVVAPHGVAALAPAGRRGVEVAAQRGVCKRHDGAVAQRPVKV